MNAPSHIPFDRGASGPRSNGGRGGRAVAAGLLGLNAWLVVHVIPALHVGWSGWATEVLGLLPPAVLGVGLALARDGSRAAAARWVLLAAFPAALAAAVTARGELTDREAYDAPAMVLAAISLLAFLAAAARCASEPPSERPSTVHPLATKEPVVEPRARRWMRRALLAVSGAGAFAVAVLAPASTDRRRQAELWGEAAEDAAVLTAVVASVVACVAIASVVGPSLRAERRSDREPGRRRRRLVGAALLAAAAGLGFALLHHFDPR